MMIQNIEQRRQNLMMIQEIIINIKPIAKLLKKKELKERLMKLTLEID